MKLNEIKNYEFIETCFGKHISVNDTDYDDLSETDVMEFIIDALNSSDKTILQKVFKTVLENIQYDREEFFDNGICDDCGNHCNSSKYFID